jgi:hypothetical protein
MANTSAPNGFLQYNATGVTPSYEQTQAAISSSNTVPVFTGDPVVQAASATGVGTGYVTQGYYPVPLTVSGIVVTNGTAVATFTAVTTNVPTSPNAWAPPIGSTIYFTGTSFATGGGINQGYTVTASTTTTVTFSVPGAFSGALTLGTVTIYVPIAGVFAGCKYLSIGQKRTVWSNYWQGSDSNSSQAVTAYLLTSPQSQFNVQTANSNTGATAVGFANIGQNIGFNYGATNGNTANGLSSAYADQYTISANPYLPFRIIGLLNYTPDGSNPLQSVNGNDYTTAYNRIIVGWNNTMFNQLSGV